jgi:hypothetical protein
VGKGSTAKAAAPSFQKGYPTISTTTAVVLSRPEAAIDEIKSYIPAEEVSIY